MNVFHFSNLLIGDVDLGNVLLIRNDNCIYRDLHMNYASEIHHMASLLLSVCLSVCVSACLSVTQILWPLELKN